MNPFEDLENILHQHPLLLKIEFFNHYQESLGEKLIKIHEHEGLIDYKEEDNIYTMSFAGWLYNECIKKMGKSINLINDKVFELSTTDTDFKDYLNLVYMKIGILVEKVETDFKEYPIIINFLNEMKLKIKNIKDYRDFDNVRNNLVPNSFSWDSLNEEDKIHQIEKLYDLLTTNPPMIESSKEEFINAFTNKAVTVGIKWLVLAKNKKTVKTSLFYLIDRLIEENFLENFPDVDYNSKIGYVFRDAVGGEFKNIRQSKYGKSKSPNPILSERIDDIIENLY